MIEQVVPSSYKWLVNWLSYERLEPYLFASEGNYEQALELYEWNITLGQILMREIAHFEIALRNTYDRILLDQWGSEQHWLFDKDSPVCRPILRKSKSGRVLDVNYVNRKTIAAIIKNAREPLNPNKVISSLSLGFWVHLSDRSRERDLWIPILHNAWPKGFNRSKLHAQLLIINSMRNRVAHNERLFNSKDPDLSPRVVSSSLTELFIELCPEAAKELNGDENPLESFLIKCPSPVEVQL